MHDGGDITNEVIFNLIFTVAPLKKVRALERIKEFSKDSKASKYKEIDKSTKTRKATGFKPL